MTSKTALVTGITGQDGAYLSKLLLEKGYTVYGAFRRTSSVMFWRTDAVGIQDHPNFIKVEYDLTDLSATIRLLQKSEAKEVYNLAAQSFVGVSFEQPITTAEITGLGALNLLEAIRIVNPKIRFYQASTSEMFGDVQAIPQKEDTPFYPRSPYGVAKLYSFWIVKNYREAYNMFACNGILFNHESPRRGETFVTRKITRATARIALGLQEKIYLGNLDAKRDWGHAKDYVRMMWMILQAEQPEDWIIATGKTTKVRDFVRFAFKEVGVELEFNGVGVNVVPCYDIKKGEWKSAADRSTFHTEFMSEKLTGLMKDDIRVLKCFLKINGMYGAEIAKQGFSGYISEVLILEFGSFENLIKSISKIKENQIIGKTSKSFDTSIIVIDPIDSNRNLAAAISNENIGKFILICRALKQKPSLEFFKTKKLKISNKFWNNLLVVKFEFKTRSPDIIWGQIKRATSTLATQLELGGFTVLRSKSHTDQQKEAYLIFFLESTKIAEIYQKKGPEFFREDSTHDFISKNLKDAELVWVGNNRKIISLEKRKHTDAVSFMKEFLKKNLQAGIPKGLQNDFKRGFKVFVGNKTLSKSIKEEVAELISVDGTLLHFN